MESGLEIANDAEDEDVLIVNPCSLNDSAQEESVDTILESAEVREANNRGQGLVVSGCLPQRFRDELPKLLPEVDAFMGIDKVAQVTEIVTHALQRRRKRLANGQEPRKTGKSKVKQRIAEFDKHKPRSEPLINVHSRPTYIPDFAPPRFRLTPRHFGYVKIAEGCNHPCSFCIIPRMRGSHRSRALKDIAQEAKALIADGVKELNLISQDSTYYGLDLRPNHSQNIASPDRFRAAAGAAETPTLCTLVRELNALPGDFWIRLLYTHPAHWTDELIQTIADCPKVARYVDMPLQHIHGNMLERMRRETTREKNLQVIRRVRPRGAGG